MADQGGPRGDEAGQQVSGRKRHWLVDTLGWVLLVWVSAANVQDREAARTVLGRLAQRFSRLVVIGADGGYTGRLGQWGGLRRWRKIRLASVPRLGGSWFTVLPKRWLVERTWAW